MKIITVIVTYNSLRKDYLQKCISSLQKSTNQIEIIIVDNKSTDDTCNFIKTNYPEITLIESKENLGFGKGNNLGIAEALKRGVDFIFLLNQDTIVKENTIELLLESAIKNKEFAILSPIHLNYVDTELEFYFSDFMKIRNTPTFYFDHILNAKKEIYETKFVNAAAWFMPRKIFFEIGGFDPIFRHYGEDNNYCQRVLFHKYKIGVLSNCYINHDSDERKTSKDYVYSKQYYSDYVKSLQIRFADLNMNIEYSLKNERNIIYFSILSSLIRFKYTEILPNFKKLSLLKSTFPMIMESRRITSVLGNHYI